MFQSALGRSVAILNSDFLALVLVKDRHIVWGNRAFHEAFGYDADELINQPTRRLFPDEQSWSAFGLAAYAAINQDGCYHTELAQMRKDGRIGWFEFSVSRLDGQPDVYVATIIDRTSRREAMQQLALQADILAAISDAVNVVSTDGIIRYTNRACETMFGYGAGELLGR
ncbi:MAG: PAS domain S-box protein, partial [Rhodocyclaceae bacterium]|nr:PAS domain S-box protein [Rhodocyclaceae bacterium]